MNEIYISRQGYGRSRMLLVHIVHKVSKGHGVRDTHSRPPRRRLCAHRYGVAGRVNVVRASIYHVGNVDG